MTLLEAAMIRAYGFSSWFNFWAFNNYEFPEEAEAQRTIDFALQKMAEK